MSPRPSKAAERRPQILAAVLRVIARRGLTATRLSDVAAEAGVSIGTVQHYFRSRRRLLMEAFAFETERAIARLLAAEDGREDAWGRLVAIVEAVTHPPTFRERWTRWLQFWAVYARDPSLRGEMTDVYEVWCEPFRGVIRAGVASGEFRPRASVADLVDTTVALLDGLALQVLLEAPGASLARMEQLVLDRLADDLRLGWAGGRDVAAGGRRAIAASSSHR